MDNTMNKQVTMDNNDLLNEKKAQLAEVMLDFAEKRVSLEDWLVKINLKEKLKAEIYEIETPVAQKVLDLEDEISIAEDDLKRAHEKLDSYRSHVSQDDHENGGALLGRASAAPPISVTLEKDIEKKEISLTAMKEKLVQLLVANE